MKPETISKVRKALEKLYDAKCNIYAYIQETNPDTKVTGSVEKLVYEDVPCRLSVKSIPSVSQTSTVATIINVMKLFMAPEIEIESASGVEPGSKIVVTKNGRTTGYKNSGIPAVYDSHQEIVVDYYDKRP